MIKSGNDYYPFGMMMPGRSYSAGRSYRYGFNGKENDKDAGEGIQDYGMRIYSERLGRFLSVDPLAKKYPWNTLYSFAENDPINYIDLDGMEKALPWYLRENKYGGKPVLTLGLGNLPIASKLEYPQYSRPDQKVFTFIHNTVVVAWNNVAGTWNDALDGKTGSDMLVESNIALGDFKLKDLKNVETWENIAGGILTAYVARRITRTFGETATSFQAKIVRNRITTAKNFYLRAGLGESEAMKHMNGINMSKKVFTTTLEKGTELEQWTYLDESGKPKLGNYYTLPGTDPSTLGIPLEGRIKTTVILQETTEFLQSTANDIENWQKPGSGEILKGGGPQLFQTNVKVKVKK